MESILDDEKQMRIEYLKVSRNINLFACCSGVALTLFDGTLLMIDDCSLLAGPLMLISAGCSCYFGKEAVRIGKELDNERGFVRRNK